MPSISHYSQFSKQHHRPLISFGQNSFKEQVDLLCELTLVLQSLWTKTISCSHIYKQLRAWFLSSYKPRYHFAVLWVFVELSKLCQQHWCLVHSCLRLNALLLLPSARIETGHGILLMGKLVIALATLVIELFMYHQNPSYPESLWTFRSLFSMKRTTIGMDSNS